MVNFGAGPTSALKKIVFGHRTRVVRPSVEAGAGKGDAADRGEHGKHPDLDGGISGRQDFAHAGGPGGRLCKMDARRKNYTWT